MGRSSGKHHEIPVTATLAAAVAMPEVAIDWTPFVIVDFPSADMLNAVPASIQLWPRNAPHPVCPTAVFACAYNFWARKSGL
jgi:hypothetical protein